MPLLPFCIPSAPSFKRHFFPHQWSQVDVLKKTGVREARGGMCFMLTIEWLSYMIKNHVSVDTSFIRLINDRILLKQIAAQQRHYLTNPLNTATSGPVDDREMVELASRKSLTHGPKFSFVPSGMADVIAQQIDSCGRPGFFEIGIFLKPGGGHSIGFAVDMFGNLALFDPNFGLAMIQTPYLGSVQRGGVFDDVIDELICAYDVNDGECARVS
ncbi:hypothetical protein [Burkholderia sp. S-53]|uniref:hypothetical protein n=1 Tax=Burkholderia sp. S-53 TaxID=2906514 RepID=UPI0021CEF272|nr:hypothetical protein [Burkholderia sp. S-53]UXU85763.1 hypothetical protein LXM88_00225 [Burkholderia sp. S-53]